MTPKRFDRHQKRGIERKRDAVRVVVEVAVAEGAVAGAVEEVTVAAGAAGAVAGEVTVVADAAALEDVVTAVGDLTGETFPALTSNAGTVVTETDASSHTIDAANCVSVFFKRVWAFAMNVQSEFVEENAQVFSGLGVLHSWQEKMLSVVNID